MTKVKMLAFNRRARFHYNILDTVEAGLVLLGSEIKAIREGRANIGESFARLESGELWLINAHIAQYSAGGNIGHDPVRVRKLLLHRQQINRIARQVTQKGYTIVTLSLYLRRNRAKVELGLARGRKIHDRRQAIKDKERKREARHETTVDNQG